MKGISEIKKKQKKKLLKNASYKKRNFITAKTAFVKRNVQERSSRMGNINSG